MSVQPTLKPVTPNDVPNQVLDWAARGASWALPVVIVRPQTSNSAVAPAVVECDRWEDSCD
jgi:hypothetical protein